MLIAAIDQGTTSTKCVLVDGAGRETKIGAARHRQILPRDGWVEHDAMELLANVRELLARAVDAGAEALALANQGETVVAWDRRDGRPIYHAIVWQDQRTTTAVEMLRQAGLETLVKDLSGLPLDPYFSASKLRWILELGSRREGTRAVRLSRLGNVGRFSSAAAHGQLRDRRDHRVPHVADKSHVMRMGYAAWRHLRRAD